MKIKKVSDITDEVLKTVQASAIHEFITDELTKANESWTSEKSNLETQIKTEKDQIVSLNEANKKLNDQIEALKNDLKQLQDKESARQAQEVFSTRMNGLESKFNFSKEELASVASQIKDMDDKSFASYVSTLEVILTAREKKESQASATPKSDEGEVKAALKNSEVVTPPVPNSSTPNKQSLKEKYAKAFSLGEGVSVNLIKGKY